MALHLTARSRFFETAGSRLAIRTLPCPHRSIWVFLRRGRRGKNKRFNT